jgi:hypothetical protein
MIDSQTPNATLEDRKFYLKVLRADARFRNKNTGRRNFCHDVLYRKHYVERIIMLRKAIRYEERHMQS